MLAVEDLTFTYPGALAPTLNGVSFHIDKGEIYGLLGPSGAGKSTAQKIFMGLLEGYGGRAMVFDAPLGALGRAYYERIGVCFELPALYLRLTARENLRLFGALYQRAPLLPDEALKLVDLVDAADQRVETFSKGMKMRLNLARALLNDPELLFLDEPTSGQDPTRARATRHLLLRLKGEGKTIFLTTHNMAEAEEVCDRVGFLAGGVVKATGVPAELKRAYGKPVLEVGVERRGAVVCETFPLEGIGRNAAFLALLARENVVSMHTQEAGLDDVFVLTTGAGTSGAEE